MAITLNVKGFQLIYDGSFLPVIEDEVSLIYTEYLNDLNSDRKGYLPLPMQVDEFLKRETIPYTVVDIGDSESVIPGVEY